MEKQNYKQSINKHTFTLVLFIKLLNLYLFEFIHTSKSKVIL